MTLHITYHRSGSGWSWQITRDGAPIYSGWVHGRRKSTAVEDARQWMRGKGMR